MNWEYALIDVVIVMAPIIGLHFYPDARWPRLKPGVLAALMIGIPYVLWDAVVTEKWWSFNPAFILGVKLGSLPIEELVFFIAVPFSCLALWENLKHMFPQTHRFKVEWILILLAVNTAFYSLSKLWWYSFVVSLVFLVFVIGAHVLKRWWQKSNFLLYMLLVSGLTLVFNMYLTARPIVTYNAAVISNLKIGSIPIEDFAFGLALVGGVTIIYELLLQLFHYDRKPLTSK